MERSWLRIFGGFWVLAGLANIVCMTMCTVALHEQGGGWAADPTQFPSTPTWLAQFFAWLTRHAYSVAFIGVAMGLLTIIAAVSFLRQRPWGRFGLEVLCWCGICVGVVSVWYLIALRQMLLGYHMTELDTLTRQLHPFGWGTWVWFGVYAVSIVLLRTKIARAASAGVRGDSRSLTTG